MNSDKQLLFEQKQFRRELAPLAVVLAEFFGIGGEDKFQNFFRWNIKANPIFLMLSKAVRNGVGL